MNRPIDASDSMINSLWELLKAATREHSEQLMADPTLAARLDADPELQSLHADRLLEKVTPMMRTPDARTYDLHIEYTSFAPVDERWTCIDLNTYDGAPDSEAPANFIGRGASEKEARMDLLAQFAEYDEAEHEKAKPRPGRVIHSSPFEPDTVIDAPKVDTGDEE